MNIEINALDTLFFRDGKPFERGEENWANGIFPPMPSVFYGALRTAFLLQNPEKSINDSGKLRIKSLYLKYQEDTQREFVFPIPLDLISFKRQDTIESQLLEYYPNTLISSKQNTVQGFLRSLESKKTEELSGKAFLRELDFEDYLNGNINIVNPIKLDSVISNEPKIGIGRSNTTGAIETGLLYRVGMLRVESINNNGQKKSFSFVVDFDFEDNPTLQSNGFMKLGGENKIVNYTTSDALTIKLPNIDSSYLKVYLATPAIFENGWYPKIFEDKLITYAVGKPQMVGGFDMQKKIPKVMQKAVPAGSVYYLKTENAKELAQELHGKSISEYRKKEGFGVCYIAKVIQNIDTNEN